MVELVIKDKWLNMESNRLKLVEAALGIAVREAFGKRLSVICSCCPIEHLFVRVRHLPELLGGCQPEKMRRQPRRRRGSCACQP